jgi:hypothetical protein
MKRMNNETIMAERKRDRGTKRGGTLQ